MRALEELLACLGSDSSITEQNTPGLTEALRAALIADGEPYPTDEECGLLVMGDDDGEPPAELCQRFKNVEKAISQCF